MFLGGKRKKSGLFVGHLGTSFGVFRATKIERRPDRPGRPGDLSWDKPKGCVQALANRAEEDECLEPKAFGPCPDTASSYGPTLGLESSIIFIPPW